MSQKNTCAPCMAQDFASNDTNELKKTTKQRFFVWIKENPISIKQPEVPQHSRADVIITFEPGFWDISAQP